MYSISGRKDRRCLVYNNCEVTNAACIQIICDDTVTACSFNGMGGSVTQTQTKQCIWVTELVLRMGAELCTLIGDGELK